MHDLSKLKSELAGDLLTDDVSRAVYSTAACMYRIEPVGVILPKNEQDVMAAVRHCRQAGIPITARGGGSGLAGQSVGSGLIIDFSRYMNASISIDEHGKTARVQPGITLGTLNALLKPRGLYFPPDPSSGNYATIGGMIANNASGSHALKYGATIDHVRSLRLVTSSGELLIARTRADSELANLNALHQGAVDIARRYEKQIETCMPRTRKNSSGYRLDRLIEPAPATPGAFNIHLQRLLCGSEGTLAIIVEAELALSEPPKHSELSVLAFSSLQSAADAVPFIMEMQPAAIEAMDPQASRIIRERRPELGKFLPEAELLLFVEFDGPAREPLLDQLRELSSEILDRRKLAGESIEAGSDAERAALWAARKALLPILYNLPGPRRVTSFIEDVAVPVENIPPYIAGLRSILKKHDAPFAVFGHAGEGNFHVRPMINLRDPAEVQKMTTIAEEVFSLVLTLGGTMSGEHGDGIVRSEFIQRQFGELYPAFDELKQLFDPAGILNPGRITSPGQPLHHNLKFGPETARADGIETLLRFAGDEYAQLVEKCQGCGTCRTLTSETSMCPVYKALQDERFSPRGKVAVLREFLAGKNSLSPEENDDVKQVLDLCLNCGTCTLECPALVDVSLLVTEARARRAKSKGAALYKRLVSVYPALTRPMPNALNAAGGAFLKIAALRFVIEKLTGIDRRRQLPTIRPARKVRPVAVHEPQERAVLFADLYASLHDAAIIRCALEILAHNKIDVIYPRQKECGIVAMTAGDISTARSLAEFNIRQLEPAAAEGRTIICTEPTAALCLKKEYGRYTDLPAAKTVADQTCEFFGFLRRLHQNGCLKTDFKPLNERFIYHTPCHTAAVNSGRPVVDILRLIPGVSVEPVQKRCCGMAGSFGIARENYELSLKIGQPLFDSIRKSGGGSVICECNSCRMQLEECMGINVEHPIKILHRAYGL